MNSATLWCRIASIFFKPQDMKSKLVNLDQIRIQSFVTTQNPESLYHIRGKSGCCLYDTGNDYNCYSAGHASMCNSTGNGDDGTGGPMG